MLDNRFFPPPGRSATRASFVTWTIGVAPLLLLLLQSFFRRHAARDEVSGGLDVLGYLIALALLVVSTLVGVVLGVMATRDAPGSRAARTALRMNAITLGLILAVASLLFVLDR
jgi:hypothetical protein